MHLLGELTCFAVEPVITEKDVCVKSEKDVCVFLHLYHTVVSYFAVPWLLLMENCCSLRRAAKLGLRDWNIVMK